jgi:hypothetical protein
MGEVRISYKILENLKERDHLRDLDVNGKVILKFTLKNRV